MFMSLMPTTNQTSPAVPDEEVPVAQKITLGRGPGQVCMYAQYICWFNAGKCFFLVLNSRIKPRFRIVSVFHRFSLRANIT